MPAASFKYSNNPLHEGGERGTPPSSPLRFGAFALGQQADMWLTLAQISQGETSHISRTLGDKMLIGDELKCH